jgi:Secretion system C-terminal sorting domain
MNHTISTRAISSNFSPPPPHVKPKISSGLEISRFKNPLHAISSTIFFMACMMPSVLAQTNSCDTPDPSPEYYAEKRAKVPQILARMQSTAPLQVQDYNIPVYVTVIRDADGFSRDINGIPVTITSADVDANLDFFNLHAAGTGIHLYRLGAVNFIDDQTLFNQPSSGSLVKENYSYVKSAFNVYVHTVSTGSGSQPGQYPITSPFKNNVLSMPPTTFVNPQGGGYAHEAGHNFGLLHTFGAPQLYLYPEVLTNNTIKDHPYDGDFPRELAIRADVPMGTKNFPDVNCQVAGDLCCDTEADCWPGTKSARFFPAFDLNNIANCKIGPINCNYGCNTENCLPPQPYRDYNEDLIPGALDNIMSYNNCNPTFSDCQRATMLTTYEDDLSSLIDLDLVANVIDKVEFKGTANPLKNVVIRWRHPASSNYTNCVSNKFGDFSGVLYDQTVTAEVRKIGSEKVFVGSVPDPSGGLGGTPYFTDIYNYGDWLDQITVYDLYLIQRHVLNINGYSLPTGYDKIAADANRNNSITTFDVTELRKLILGIYQSLPGVDAPWLYTPEYIPQDFASQFNFDPFRMDINGQIDVAPTVYLDSDWEYDILPSWADKRGYDGIKIGDVVDSPQFCDEDEIEFLNLILMAPNQVFEIDIKAEGFIQVEAFQMGMFIDHEKLEVLDLTAGDVPSFSKEENAGLTMLEENKLNIAWFNPFGQASALASQNNSLFKLTVKALQPIASPETAISIHNEQSELQTGFFNALGCVEGIQLQAAIVPLSTLGRAGDRNAGDAYGEQLANELFCYPNPASNQISLMFEHDQEAQQATLTIYDGQGRVMKSLPVSVQKGINNKTFNIGQDFGNLPQAMYNITLITENSVKTGRFFIK